MSVHKLLFDAFFDGTPFQIPDPGNGNKLSPDRQAGVYKLVSAGAETRTLQDPKYANQRLLIQMMTDGGDIVVTADSQVDEAGTTVFTFDDTGDMVDLVGVNSGGSLEWRIVGVEGISELAAAEGLWSKTGTVIHPNDATTETVAIGDTTAGAMLDIVGFTSTVGLIVENAATTPGNLVELNSSSGSGGDIVLVTSAGVTDFSMVTNTATSGSVVPFSITPTYNQASGTAANTDLLVNRTETAVGSGTQRLLDLQIGGSSRFNVSNQGFVAISSSGAGALLDINKSSSKTAWTGNGIALKVNAATYTDTSSSGTVAENAVNAFLVPSLAADSVTTYTDATNVSVLGPPTAGANVTLTNTSHLLLTGTITATGPNVQCLRITPTYNQASGSAANTDILVNRTETAVGSGTQRLIDLQVGGTSRFSVDSRGFTVINSAANTSDATLTLAATPFNGARLFFDGGSGIIATKAGQGNLQIGVSTTAPANTHNLYFSVGSTATTYGNAQKVAINSSGFVGINKLTSMGAMLHVVGTTSSVGLILENAATTPGNLLECNTSGGSGGDILAISSTGALTLKNTANSATAYRIQDSSGTNVLLISTTSSRIGLATSTLSGAVSIGGDRVVAFIGGNATFNNASFSITYAAAIHSFTTGDVRINGDVNGAALNIVPKSTSEIALSLKQFAAGTATLISLFDSSGNQTMGVTTTGLTRTSTSPGTVGRFLLEQNVTGTNADDEGVGLSLRTENSSGTVTAVAQIDAVFDDISAHQASLRFLVKDDTSSTSTPAELARIEGETGNFGIGTTGPAGKLHIDQASATGAKPVLTLDQADVDEDFFKFIGTSDTSADRALVDAADFSTPGAIAGYLKINIEDAGDIPDGDYYIAFRAVPTA